MGAPRGSSFQAPVVIGDSLVTPIGKIGWEWMMGYGSGGQDTAPYVRPGFEIGGVSRETPPNLGARAGLGLMAVSRETGQEADRIGSLRTPLQRIPAERE